MNPAGFDYLRTVVPCCVLGAAVFLTGCGGQGRTSVNGKVTLDGKPVEKGMISFVPVEQTTGKPAWSEIDRGTYSIPQGRGPRIGAHRVEIRAPRKTGRFRPARPPAQPMEIWREAVPQRYNSRSELRVQLEKHRNQCDFELTSE